MRRQRGISLVSLMVGLVISLTATLGLLSVYRNALQVTTVATVSTTNDSQLASLLVRTGASLEDAGYGITGNAFGTQLIAISGAALNGNTLTGTVAAANTAVNAVVWTMATGATTQCAGFYAPSTGGLVYLSPITCTDATGWNTARWFPATVAPQSSSAILFTVAQQSCAPYGITSTLGNYTVSLSTTNSIGTAVTSVQCLINFQ